MEKIAITDFKKHVAITILGSLLCKISTKDFDLSTLISSIKIKDDIIYNNIPFDFPEEKATVTASFTLGIKNLFGENVMPIFRFNTGNYAGAKENIGVGVVISPSGK